MLFLYQYTLLVGSLTPFFFPGKVAINSLRYHHPFQVSGHGQHPEVEMWLVTRVRVRSCDK